MPAEPPTRRVRARRGEGDLLRDEILDAAETLLLKTEDADSVSIRAIGQAVGITAPSIYRHFEDKDVLIRAVSARCFGRWDADATEALEGVTEPLEVIKTMVRSFLRFGLANPGPYRVMMMTPGLENTRQDRMVHLNDSQPNEKRGIVHLIEIMRQASTQKLVNGDPTTVAIFLWSGVHGIISMKIAMGPVMEEEPEELLELLLRSWSLGILTEAGRKAWDRPRGSSTAKRG